MLTRHVALVSERTKIPMSELSAVAAALQKQATRDLKQSSSGTERTDYERTTY